MPFHKCEDSDWKKFAEPNKYQENRVKKLKSEKVMNCLNMTFSNGTSIDYTLYGSEESAAHRRLQFTLIPTGPDPTKSFPVTRSECEINMTSEHAEMLARAKKYVAMSELLVIVEH